MNKKFLILALLLVAAIALVGCTQKAAEPAATSLPTATATAASVIEVTPTPASVTEVSPKADTDTKAVLPLELTLEELAKFNGKDGQPAYIAVDGIIYDVSNASAWKDGVHAGYDSGKDLTLEIKTKSPHGISKLSDAVEIGKLVTR